METDLFELLEQDLDYIITNKRLAIPIVFVIKSRQMSKTDKSKKSLELNLYRKLKSKVINKHVSIFTDDITKFEI